MREELRIERRELVRVCPSCGSLTAPCGRMDILVCGYCGRKTRTFLRLWVPSCAMRIWDEQEVEK